MTPRDVFIGVEGRLRAPWRLILFFALFVSCVIVVMAALAPGLAALQRVVGIEGTREAYGIAIALLLAHWMTFRTFDQRPWTFVGLQRDAARPKALAAGALLGVAPIAAASLALVGAGWLAITPAAPGSWGASALKISLLLLPAALYEELLSRGYIFATVRDWLGAPAAIGLTSLGFGLLHIPNPGANFLPIVVVTLAGAYLAVVLLVTRSLFAAWIAHFAWNAVLAVGLHVSVSGLPFETPHYRSVENGPDWITGGSWGPEGGVAAAVAMMVGLGIIYLQRSRLSAFISNSGTPGTEGRALTET